MEKVLNIRGEEIRRSYQGLTVQIDLPIEKLEKFDLSKMKIAYDGFEIDLAELRDGEQFSDSEGREFRYGVVETLEDALTSSAYLNDGNSNESKLIEVPSCEVYGEYNYIGESSKFADRGEFLDYVIRTLDLDYMRESFSEDDDTKIGYASPYMITKDEAVENKNFLFWIGSYPVYSERTEDSIEVYIF